MRNQEHHLYETWKGMRKRCRNKATYSYQFYGGRGISICERWEDFWIFVADMGDRPDGTTLDRIDNNGNYEPGNCRWATLEVQGSNKRSHRLRFIEFGGLRLNVAQWAKRLGVAPSAISHRIRKYGEQKAIAMGSKVGAP